MLLCNIYYVNITAQLDILSLLTDTIIYNSYYQTLQNLFNVEI